MVRSASKEFAKARTEGLLVNAAHLFAKKGFHDTTVDDIAGTLKLSKRSIYDSISSKPDLVYQLHRYATGVLIDRVKGIVETSDPPDVKLRKIMVAHLADDLSGMCGLIIRALIRTDVVLPNVQRARVIKKRDQYVQMVRRVILEGIEQGIFAECDVTVVCLYIFGALNYSSTWFRERGRLSKETIANHFADFTLNMLLADRSRLLENGRKIVQPNPA